MKKSAAKSTAAKTPAPATKVEPAAMSVVKKVVAAVKAPVVKAAKVAAKAPKPAKAIKPAAPIAPVKPADKAKPVKAPAPKAQPTGVAVTTTIVAAIDVGFGNALTLRGEGPGLSWEVGAPMVCSADDRWTITLPESSQPIVCKFLLNDTTWSCGEDYTVLPGSSVVLSPSF